MFPPIAGVEISRVVPQQVDLPANTLRPLSSVGAQESSRRDLRQFPPSPTSRALDVTGGGGGGRGGGGGGW